MSNCTVCNSVIKSNRRGKKYCSNACKQRAYNDRKLGITAPASPESPFVVYKMIKEKLGPDYHIPFVEFLFIKSCNPFVSEIDDLAMLVSDCLENAYDFDGDIDPVYKQGLEAFSKKWYARGVGRVS